MTTTLAAQLSEIRSTSSHPLNLKKRKRLHAQSLLFDSQTASEQDFESIYRLCNNGFVALCKVDRTFEQFSETLFSPHSVTQDRSDLAVTVSRQIDLVIERFFLLVGPQLPLESALKAVEWLVRRFRVHELNNEALLLAFLPYHDHAIFQKLLPLLSNAVPFGFLHPYVTSTICPPRHIIARALSHNASFFKSLNAFFVQTCRMRCLHSLQVTFWASIMSNAVARLCDQCHTGDRSVQRQKEADLLLRVFPVLHEVIVATSSSQAQTASYMICIVLTSNVQLDQAVLAELAGVISSNLKSAPRPALLSMTALFRFTDGVPLPDQIISDLQCYQHILDDLHMIQDRPGAAKLVAALVLGLVKRLNVLDDASTLAFCKAIWTSRLLSQGHRAEIRDKVRSMLPERALLVLQDTGDEDSYRRVEQLESSTPTFRNTSSQPSEGLAFSEGPNPSFDEKTEIILESTSGIIRTRVDHAEQKRSSTVPGAHVQTSQILESLLDRASSSSYSLLQCLEYSEFQAVKSLSAPEFYSFLVRVWCGTRATSMRTTSVRLVSEYLAEHVDRDPQFLIPYIISGLSDSSVQVRKALGGLLGVLVNVYEGFDGQKTRGVETMLDIHATPINPKSPTASLCLSQQDVLQLLKSCIVPGLEELLADGTRMLPYLVTQISGRDPTGPTMRGGSMLKRSTRAAIFRFLCNHAVQTPLYQVKYRLITMLNNVERVGPETSSNLLSSLVPAITSMPSTTLLSSLRDSGVDSDKFMQAIVNVITPTNPQGVLDLLDMTRAHNVEGLYDVHRAALGHICDIFHQLPTTLQVNVLRSLLQLSVDAEDVDVDLRQENNAYDVLSRVRVPPAALRDLLREHAAAGTFASDHNDHRLSESSFTENMASHDIDAALGRLSRILDNVNHDPREFDPQLLDILNSILAATQNTGHAVDARRTYLQSLVLERMLALVKASERGRAPQLQHSMIKMDVIIECVRASASPQIRNVGLLLLSALAQRLPELALHNIMPIFATLSSKVLPQEDEYSASIVRRTLDSLVPRLIEALRKRKGSEGPAMAELLFNFAAAFEHIKPQRRLDAYMLLMDRIEIERYLYLFIAILINTHSTSKRVEHFAAHLVGQYGVETRLKVVARYLQFLNELLSTENIIEQQVYFLEAGEDRSLVVRRLYTFILHVLANETTAPTHARSFDPESFQNPDVFAAYGLCVENAFVLSANLGSRETQQTPFLEILNALLRLVPTKRLIGVLQGLLNRSDGITRQQVLRSLHNKIAQTSDISPSKQETVQLAQAVMASFHDTADKGEKLEALRCAEQIMLATGNRHPQMVLSFGKMFAQQLRSQSNDQVVDVECLMCLCTVLEVGKDVVIPIVPIMLQILEMLLAQSTHMAPTTPEMSMAAYTMLSTITLALPWMITGPSLERLLPLCYESANAEAGEKVDKARQSAVQSLAKTADVRSCLGALNDTWQAAMSEGPLAASEHLGMVKCIVQRLPPGELVLVCDLLESVIQKSFDLRRIQLLPRTEDSYSEAEIDIVEAVSIETAMALVYKLNDKIFEPIFRRLTDWAIVGLPESTSKGRAYRSTTFFKFLASFFSSLKGIVTHYAIHIIGPASSLLQSLQVEDLDLAQLWRLILQALSCTFEHDHNDFYQAPSHFSTICTALASQLSRAHVVDVTSEVIPAVVDFAGATDSSTQHRHLHAEVLNRLRSPNSAVRLGAIKCELALTERLGNEWMALLPEMLPALSELQEDDDESVEHETLRLIRKIEEIVGESLDAMLQ